MMSTTSRLMMLNCRACTFRARFINRVIVPSVSIPRRRPHSSSSSGDENDQGFTTTTSSSLSPKKGSGSGSGGNEWRKLQLEKIENKFSDQEQEDPSLLKIKSDEELQEMWKQMESRVKNRRPRTLRETGGKTGRVNVKKTDEEMWLKEGLYSSCDDDDDDDDGKKN